MKKLWKWLGLILLVSVGVILGVLIMEFAVPKNNRVVLNQTRIKEKPKVNK